MLPILNDVRQQNREVWRLTICWARCRANADSNSWLWCDWIQQVTIVTVICWDLAHKTPTWRPFCFNKWYDFQWSKPCKNRSFVEVDGFLMLSDQSSQTWQILGAKRVFSSNNKTVAPNLCSLHFGCYRSGTSGAQRLGVFCFSKQPIATKQKSPRETQEAETRKAIFIHFFLMDLEAHIDWKLWNFAIFHNDTHPIRYSLPFFCWFAPSRTATPVPPAKRTGRVNGGLPSYSRGSKSAKLCRWTENLIKFESLEEWCFVGC